MSISAAEQYFIELVNRARLDPAAEAKRVGIALNEELARNTITTDAKTPLAVNLELTDSSRDHSLWMLSDDTFSHTGSGGSSVRQRIEAAGYTLSGSWSVGENLSWRTTGGSTTESLIDAHHRALFDSSGHRVNFFSDYYREIGVAEEQGYFRYNGTDYYSSMVTHNFARSGSDHFITGVVYSDGDRDGFYSIGEGRGGVRFQADGSSATSMSAGGYALSVSPASSVTVTITASSKSGQVTVDMSDGNVKLDVVNGGRLLSSGDLTVKSAWGNVTLIGSGDLELRGNAGNNKFYGNVGDNLIIGNGGNDVLIGRGGKDKLGGGNGADTLKGGGGNDVLIGGDNTDVLLGGDGRDYLKGGSGNDMLRGNAGADRMEGGTGNDVIVGNGGNDRLKGGWGNDTLRGNIGADRMEGGAGKDVIFGNDGRDVMMGNTGDDRLLGGKGNDRINGGRGLDKIEGNGGADDFVFRKGNDIDIIYDFRGGQGDTLMIDDALWSGTLTKQQVIDRFGSDGSKGSTLDFGGGDELRILGVTDVDDLVDHIEFL